MQPTPVLETRGIIKDFPGVRALSGVDFTLAGGEVLALVGENGAGKSTLMKVLSGVYPHGTYGGSVYRDGELVAFGGTRDAERAGVAIIHQELNLFGDLTVVENLFVGRYPRTRLGLVDWAAMRRRTSEILAGLRVSFGADARIRDLSVGDGQMVEIARALLTKAKILILDEPTSALSDREVERLFSFVGELRRAGTACIYISHKLDEVFQLADRVAVLRDGRTVGGGRVAELTREDLITMMVGRPMESLFPQKPVATATAPMLRAAALGVRSANNAKSLVRNVSFEAFPGEILGIGGMMGAGRTELLYAIMGHPDFKRTGHLELAGKPAQGRQGGVGLVTEDRKRTGLHIGMSIRENISMASLGRISRQGILDLQAERVLSETMMRRLRIKAPHDEVRVSALSGGNQQKVAIAKWCAIKPQVLMLDEPTRGVDVGAKFEIYSLLRELALDGVAVIVVSSELLELVGLCHRVMVMREGELAGSLTGPEVSSEAIMRLAVGRN